MLLNCPGYPGWSYLRLPTRRSTFLVMRGIFVHFIIAGLLDLGFGPHCCGPHSVLRNERFRRGSGVSPPPTPTRLPPNAENKLLRPLLLSSGGARTLSSSSTRSHLAYPLSLRVATGVARYWLRRRGAKANGNRLRDESGPLGSSLARVLCGLGTHVAQKLPRLAKVFNDAGIRFRGGSGHLDSGPFLGVYGATDDRKAPTTGACLPSWTCDDHGIQSS